MLGTIAVAVAVVAASIPLGAAVLWLAGRREWSWIAPALGLAVMTVAAWLLVRLPGEGATALIGLAVLALGCCAALPRVGFGLHRLAEGAVPAVLVFVAVLVPFAVEGHFGILGTGFNVDMSQHLFAATGIAADSGPTPTLVGQGYPVGPHSLAAAFAEPAGGNLVSGFTGVTIAIPVLLALTALAGTGDLGARRGIIAAALVALPYLLASYFAQGAFKELFEATFLLATVLWLRELERGEGVEGARFLLPGAVLVAGTLYAYSGPGVVWLAGAAGVWALIRLARSPSVALARARSSLPAIGIALVVLVVLVAPEASRIADFGASAGNIADAKPEPQALPLEGEPTAAASDSDAQAAGADDRPELEDSLREGNVDYDNSLGNLFGFIPALEVLGVWPTGDFRVAAGAGAIPAPVFYLGALIGLAGLGIGLRRALAEREDALLAGLAAALAIWLGALILSTPYTSAKALAMVAPLLMLVSVRGVLAAELSGLRPRPGLGAVFAAVFVAAVAGSSLLALANAPVGPAKYSTAVAKFRDGIVGKPVLLLAPAEQIKGQHAEDFYRWELRGADVCVVPVPEDGPSGEATPAPYEFVIATGASTEAPFADLRRLRTVSGVELYTVEAPDGRPDPRSCAEPAG